MENPDINLMYKISQVVEKGGWGYYILLGISIITCLIMAYILIKNTVEYNKEVTKGSKVYIKSYVIFNIIGSILFSLIGILLLIIVLITK